MSLEVVVVNGWEVVDDLDEQREDRKCYNVVRIEYVTVVFIVTLLDVQAQGIVLSVGSGRQEARIENVLSSRRH